MAKSMPARQLGTALDAPRFARVSSQPDHRIQRRGVTGDACPCDPLAGFRFSKWAGITAEVPSRA